MSHAVLVSHVVWTHVVPWWSNHCVSPAAWRRHDGVLQRQQELAGWLMGVGEGVWPLVPLACRALAALPVLTRGVPRFTRYTRLTWAALAGAKACIRWLLRNDGGGHTPAAQGQGETAAIDSSSTSTATTPVVASKDSRGGGGRGIVGGLVGWVESRVSGRGVTDKSSSKNIRRRSRDKEIMAVLLGLCGGGHTAMAMALAQVRPSGSDITRWWREECGLVWPGDGRGDRDLVELIRSRTGYNSLLCQVCKNGHLETAKWVVERFGIREVWEVVLPLQDALESGQLGIAKWLYGAVSPSPKSLFAKRGDVFHSGRLDVVQWAFLERFQNCSACVEGESRVIGSVSASTSCDDTEIIRLCDWTKENFALKEPPSLDMISNLAVMKWVVSTYGVGVTGNYTRRIAFWEPKIIEWVLVEKAVPPTFDLLTNLCKNPHEPLSLVKWLSERLPSPTPEQITTLLCCSLSHNNTHIADWLEETHHNDVKSSLCSNAWELMQAVVKDTDEFRDSVAGVEWLLRRCPTLNSSDETSVEFTMWRTENVRVSLLLLEAFHIDYLKHTALLKMKLEQMVVMGSIEQVKKFVSLVGRDSITKEIVTFCLTHDSLIRHSSKVVKWLIKEFHLGESEVKANSNVLVCSLISQGKNHCAEWLIHSFDITMNEFLVSMRSPKAALCHCDLHTLRMIMRVFPSITAKAFKEKGVRNIAASSPVTAQFLMHKFPSSITLSDFREGPSCSFLTTTWLDSLHT